MCKCSNYNLGKLKNLILLCKMNSKPKSKCIQEHKKRKLDQFENETVKKQNKNTPVKISKIPVSIRNVKSTGKSISESKQTNIYYGLSDIETKPSKQEDIPDMICVSYINDFNLVKVHETIIRKLKAESNNIENLKEELDLQIDIIQKPQTIIDRNKTLKKIKNIEAEINSIQQGLKIHNYLLKAEPMIQEYKKLVPQNKKIDFTFKKEEEIEDEEKDPEYRKKMRVISNYLEFAKKYIKINITQKKKNPNKCGCGCDLSNVPIDNFGTQICPECMTERHIIGFNIYKSDTLASRNDYSDRDNFEKALMRYQGKQVDKIPDTLFGDLDKYFTSRGKLDSETIKKQPLNSRGRKNGTGLPMLYKALLATGYSSLYEDANLIAHRYWGWKLPDVTHLESVIIEDYKKTQRVYNMLQKKRSSSLGTQFRLFKHLEMRGHPCSIGDFKVVKMRESVEHHNAMWRLMCEGCEDPDIYFIPTI